MQCTITAVVARFKRLVPLCVQGVTNLLKVPILQEVVKLVAVEASLDTGHTQSAI